MVAGGLPTHPPEGLLSTALCALGDSVVWQPGAPKPFQTNVM